MIYMRAPPIVGPEMSVALRLDWEPDDDPAESRRRQLLALGDDLLDRVEDLRLQDRRAVPQDLRDRIRAYQLQLGRLQQPVPGSAGPAHELLLSLQARLLAANPRNTTPRSHPGRGGGQPLMTVVQGGARWKVLTLPPLSSGQPREEWLELVDATVERARDRWEWALHQAQAVARGGHRWDSEWATSRAAWLNYWELLLDRDRVASRLSSLSRAQGMPLSA